MFKLYKNAFKLTNEGILLAIPLILFIWVVTIYLSFSRHFVDTMPEAISAFVTLLCMSAAFCAGWFYMVKKSIALSKKEFVIDEDRAKEILELIKKIPTGIGKYFLPFIGFSLLSILICSIGISRIYLGVHYTSDVLGGFLVSISYLILFISTANKFFIEKD